MAILAGEFDPTLIGDACLIEITTQQGPVGLLTGFDECVDAKEDLHEGREVTVYTDTKNRINDDRRISILKQVSGAKAFYYVDFGAIENGLAD